MTDLRRRAATLEDVAREAKVSRATASRVIRGESNVSPAASKAVDRAVKKLGYVPNHAARSLATRRSSNILVIVAEPDTRIFTDPFFATAVAGVAQVLETTPYTLNMMMRSHDFLPKLERYLASGLADGVVVISHHRSDGLPQLFERIGVPYQFVGRPVDLDQLSDNGDFSAHRRYVDTDNFTGGKLVAQLLAERGVKNPAMIGGPNDMAAAIDRRLGFFEGLRAHGYPKPPYYVGDFSTEGARSAAEQIVTEHPEVDGIFAASDTMAAAAIGTLTSLGRVVPDDVAVVGFDNSHISNAVSPRITTFTNSGLDLATRATQRLMDELKGVMPTEAEIIVPQEVRRESA